MITITYKHINDTPMEQALGRISNMPLPIKAAHSVAKIKRQILNAIGERRKTFTDAVKNLSSKDENGATIYDPTGMPAIAKENQDALAKVTEEVMAGELKIDWRKLEYSELANCQLTANEIEALGPLVNGLEEAVPAPETAEAANS